MVEMILLFILSVKQKNGNECYMNVTELQLGMMVIALTRVISTFEENCLRQYR